MSDELEKYIDKAKELIAYRPVKDDRNSWKDLKFDEKFSIQLIAEALFENGKKNEIYESVIEVLKEENAMLNSALRRQTREAISFPEVQALVDELESLHAHKELGNSGIDALANFTKLVEKLK